MTVSKQSSDLNNQIIDLVEKCWKEKKIPLLLSRLGDQDNGDIARYAKAKFGGLATYLRQELVDRVRLVQHGTKPTVMGVVPAEAEIKDDDIDEYLDKAGSQFTSSIPRFHPAFWTAFRKPLDESRRRYMSIREPFYFQDIISENKPDGFVEVVAKYIAGLDSDSAEVYRRAQDWLSANQIKESRFISKREAKEKRSSSNNLLDKLLLTLGPEDLRRISMPLDIVEKLRR